MATVLHLKRSVESHEEIFMARYDRIRAWALHLSSNDRSQAEDLIQEAFVQFTLTNADLETIHNIDGYLFGLLRILHLSQLRRSRTRTNILRTILDYDAAIIGLRAADARNQIIVREQLQRVCQYACSRKATSKAGSVLILRFFLGYFPGEIALLAKSTRSAVEERLRLARAEAKSFLDKPGSLKILGEEVTRAGLRGDLTAPLDLFLRELRLQIFGSRNGECRTAKDWKRAYAGGASIDCGALGHLASCATCLDIVNQLLELPLLAERHPVDTLRKDTRDRDGGGSGSNGGTGGDGGGDDGQEGIRCRQRACEVLEHHPSELCVAVNGNLVGSQKVAGKLNEQTFSIAEGIEFIEVFSEQDVRLLLLHVAERPPDGPLQHSTVVDLHDGRRVEAHLSLNYPSSSLRVAYSNRSWQAEMPQELADDYAHDDMWEFQPALTELTDGGTEEERKPGILHDFLDRLRRRLGNYQTWIRPATAAVTLVLILSSLFFLTRFSGPVVSASELLVRSAVAERLAANDSANITHRVLQLEQASEGGAVLKRRIEIWHNALRGLTVRRVYGETDQAVIAERLGSDGSRVVALPGLQPTRTFEPRRSAEQLVAAGAIWRLSPSAEVFLELTNQGASARVEQSADTYSITYHRAAEPAKQNGVLEAALIVRKTDLRGIELRIISDVQGTRSEYRLTEQMYGKRPTGEVPPSAFEIGATAFGSHSADRRPAAAVSVPLPSSSTERTGTASPELEIEVNYLLHKIRANIGEQVAVERTAGGALRVEAVAESEARKREILQTLAAVADHPAVKIYVTTVDEAAAGNAKRQGTTTSTLDIEVRDDTGEIDSDLRRSLRSDIESDSLARGEILQLSSRVMGHSRRAVQHAVALKRLTGKFSTRQSGALADPAREKLLLMIRAHAERYSEAVRAIRQELRPLSPTLAGGEQALTRIYDDADLARAVDRLLQMSQSNDSAVRTAFAVSAEGQSLTAVKSAAFWVSLGNAESLSRSIADSYP